MRRMMAMAVLLGLLVTVGAGCSITWSKQGVIPGVRMFSPEPVDGICLFTQSTQIGIGVRPNGPHGPEGFIGANQLTVMSIPVIKVGHKLGIVQTSLAAMGKLVGSGQHDISVGANIFEDGQQKKPRVVPGEEESVPEPEPGPTPEPDPEPDPE